MLWVCLVCGRVSVYDFVLFEGAFRARRKEGLTEGIEAVVGLVDCTRSGRRYR